MAIVKSKIIKQLSDNYPNFVKKDLIKLIDIILNDMKNSLGSGEQAQQNLEEMLSQANAIQESYQDTPCLFKNLTLKKLHC